MNSHSHPQGGTILGILVIYYVYPLVTECPQLLSPANGIVTIKYTMSNAFAVYSCNEKYALKGNSDRTCTNQEWDGIEPECIRKFCMCFIFLAD